MDKPNRIDHLSMWEWDTLVAAWRYYEHRYTFASAMFPAQIVEHYWGVNGARTYSDEVRHTIAHQFAIVDHGIRGIADWDPDAPMDAGDAHEWRKFYAFCHAYVTGFDKVTVRRGKRKVAVRAFDLCGRWYPVSEYVSHPGREIYIPNASICK